MSLRPFEMEDCEACIESFEDAYQDTYYRPLVYYKEGWEEWYKDPYVNILVYEIEGTVMGVTVDFWNPLGWLEFGGLAAISRYRKMGIGESVIKRNYMFSILMLTHNVTCFTVPYIGLISNGARNARTLFCGVNGIYKINNERVIFSVYNGANESRFLSRIPCYIPESIKPFFKRLEKFVGTKFRRQYKYQNLKGIKFKTTDKPDPDVDWSVYPQISNYDPKNYSEEGDVTYKIDAKNKIIRIMDIKESVRGLDKLMEKQKKGYVFDTRINLGSRQAPWIVSLLMKKYDFKFANLCLASATLDGDKILTIKKAEDKFIEPFQTADVLELTTSQIRECILSDNVQTYKDDPNVVDFLQKYSQGHTYNSITMEQLKTFRINGDFKNLGTNRVKMKKSAKLR